MDLILIFPQLSHEQQEAILDGPAMSPPEGVVPNLTNPDNRNGMAIAFSTVCILVVFALLGTRFYSRLFVLKKANIEDYLGVLAFMTYVGIIATFYIHLCHGGFFVQQWNIRFRDFQKSVEAGVSLTMVYAATMIFAKTAILFEWARIFSPNGTRRNAFWRMSRLIMAVNILFYSGGMIGEATACIPLSKIWQPWQPGRCIDTKVLDITAAYFNLAIDMFILLLPQSVIWKLHLTRSKKFGVSIIFSFGILTVVSAIGRVVSNYGLAYVDEGDTNYTLGPVFMWGFAEATCVLIVFSIPAVPKAFADTWISTRLGASLRSCSHWIMAFRRGSFRHDNSLSTRSRTQDSEELPQYYRQDQTNTQTELAALKQTPSSTNSGSRQSAGGTVGHHTEFAVREPVDARLSLKQPHESSSP